MSQLGINDAILAASLVYSCIDLGSQWELFAQCERPIHRWLVVNYACLFVFRLIHVVGSHLLSDGAADLAVDFLLNLRPKGRASKALVAFNWLVVTPFFVVWTLVGTRWLHEVATLTPTCVPSDTYLWFATFWVALSYVWLLVQLSLCGVACFLEWKVMRVEQDLRAIEDDDVRSRWGSISTLSSYASLGTFAGPLVRSGFSPAEIGKLAGLHTCTAAGVLGEADQAQEYDIECAARREDTCECSICLSDVKLGDQLRRLPQCGHTFHRACVDVWLLRCADCPLCKRNCRMKDP